MGDLERAWRSFRARPAADRGRLLRTVLQKLGTDGLGGTLAWARRSGSPAREPDHYRQWCLAHTPDEPALVIMRKAAKKLPYRPTFSIVTPVYNTDPKWLEACAESVLAQVYRNWQWSIGNDGSTKRETLSALKRIAALDPRISVHHAPRNGGISAATNLALSHATGDYVGLMDHDDALLPHAVYKVMEHLNRPGTRADVLYTDEDKLDFEGERCEPYFKPDWSPDHFLSNMYVCHFLVARRALIHAVGGFRTAFDFSQDYDLMLRLMEKANRIDHVADILYHWRKVPQSAAADANAKPTAHIAGSRALQDYLDRNHLPGRIEDVGPAGFYRTVFSVVNAPKVSVIADLDEAARQRLREATNYPALEFADSPFDATGQLLLFLESNLDPQDPQWLDALVQIATRPGVGAVGAKILRANGTIEHLGLVLGLGGVVGRPFLGAPGNDVGYFGSGLAVRTLTAVGGACLMTPRAVFDGVKGMVELDREATAIDYCLRVAESGRRVVITPFAVLRRTPETPVPEVSTADADALRARWGTRLDTDRHYNPNLTREHLDYLVGA